MNKSSFGYIIYPLFPILLITGPALPDIALVLFILLVIIFRNDLFFQIKQKWMIFLLILWLWFLFISLKHLSGTSASGKYLEEFLCSE